MFDYPLLFRRDTLYARIGLSPEASPAEIREAKGEREEDLNRRRMVIQQRLAGIHKQVPAFEPARKELKELEKQQGQDAARRSAASQFHRLEAEVSRRFPEFQQLERESTEIDSKINELHNMRLESPEERLKYDTATPPCALVKLSRHDIPVVTDQRVRLHAVRREVAAFLEQEKNTHCFHPSDWTRRLFMSDYEQVPLLDEEME
jgi:hypothetical protein